MISESIISIPGYGSIKSFMIKQIKNKLNK